MHRIGVIGTGIIAKENIGAAVRLPHLEVSALCNRTVSKAVGIAKEFGLEAVPVFADYRKMIDRVPLDAVVVNLPHHLHAPVFEYCAERGLHVLMEKPLGVDPTACRTIVRCRERTGVKLMVCHTQRYSPYYRSAKAVIDSSRLGKLLSIQDVILYDYFYEGRPSWFLDPEQAGGGILMNYGVHMFDRIEFLSGKKTKSLLAHVDWEMPNVSVDSGFQILGEMEDGVSYTMTCEGASGPFVAFTNLMFSNGILRVNLVNTSIDDQGVWVGSNSNDFQGESTAVPTESPYLLQMSDFQRLLDGEMESPIPAEYGARMVALVHAAYRSHESGQPETL